MDKIAEIADKRRNLAWTILKALYDRIPREAYSQAEILVSFSSDDLADAIRKDLTLQVAPDKMLAAIDRGLLFLHEQKIIILQKGLSVFRQAMSVRILPESKGRSYSKGDYAPLSHHYGQRVFQVHVMNEYARQGLRKIGQALSLVAAYFAMSTTSFIRRFFGGREDVLKMATGEESFKKIVERLRHPIQESLVAADPDESGLVLAGPGSGKTRTVVHRCASFAARADAAARDEKKTAERFDAVIRDATALLKGEKTIPGLDPDEIRDRLLAGFRHIIVDEYQDIDAEQYALVSAVAGRTLKDLDSKLSILAVGDDDQSIYRFRGANVEFIRRFQEDYGAKVQYLVENYRSTANIVAAANELIRKNRDREKTEHPIRIDRRRKADPPGGRWESLDPLARGRVQRLSVANVSEQAATLAAEMERFRSLDPDFEWTDVAVLSRNGFACRGYFRRS